MSRTVFIDANVPIYAAGRDHPNKKWCAQVLVMAAEHPLVFVTDAEVLQELLHRYVASGRWALGRGVLREFVEVMRGRIEPVYPEDIDEAARLADLHKGVSARDLVHAAVMHRLETDRIVSVDADFDRLPDIIRLDPSGVESWGDSLLAL